MGRRGRTQCCLLKDQRGVAAVEFIVVAGLLVFILFAIVEMGSLFSTRILLIQAARAGVRQAVIDGGASAKAVEVTREQLRLGGLNPEAFDINITPRNASYGTVIRISLAHDYQFRTPVARLVGGRSLRFMVTLLGRSENLGGG